MLRDVIKKLREELDPLGVTRVDPKSLSPWKRASSNPGKLASPYSLSRASKKEAPVKAKVVDY